MFAAVRASLVRRLFVNTLALTLAVTALVVGSPTAATATSPAPTAAADGDVCIGATPPSDLYVTSTKRASVYRLYCAAFLRLPDTSGLDYWTGEVLAHRLDVAGMADAFISSAEFVQRYGAVDDRGFLDLVYRNVLGRPSDDVGYRYWATQLARRDFDRGDLLISFSESAEFTTATGTASAAAAGDRAFLRSGMSARAAADAELARGTYVATQCQADQFGGNVRWVRSTWNLTWCVRTDPNWPASTTDAVYVHEAFHARISLLYVHRDALTTAQRAEVERVVNDKAANEGLADLWTMRLVPGYGGAPQYANDLFTNAIWEELFARYPLGGDLPG
ncbi:MAG: DUF4214 domain-containing protein [Acidimicrobiales bacterium]